MDLVFSELRSDTNKEHMKSVITTEIQRWFWVQSMDDPKTWMPRVELFSAYEELKANKYTSSKAKQRQANILHNEKLRQLKAARRIAKETNSRSTSKGLMKIIASTEESRGSEKDRQKREKRQLVVMTQICNFRRQLESLDKQIGLPNTQKTVR